MNNKKLIFIGAGELAREMLWAASALDPSILGWAAAGFIDDDVDRARQHISAKGICLPVFGSIRDHQPKTDEVFICAIGKTKVKLKCAEMMAERGAEFVNLIHPSANIAPDAKVGTGIFLFIHSLISTGAEVSDHTALNVSASVGHDARVGPGCTISSYCDITGNACLGAGVFMGSHACILQGVKVGDYAVVGAGSVVIRKVPVGASVMGVPARSIL
jgi:sugar O-acyltransferase (sialic acid O-acetyltransferase NeuD family)